MRSYTPAYYAKHPQPNVAPCFIEERSSSDVVCSWILMLAVVALMLPVMLVFGRRKKGTA